MARRMTYVEMCSLVNRGERALAEREEAARAEKESNPSFQIIKASYEAQVCWIENSGFSHEEKLEALAELKQSTLIALQAVGLK